MKNQSFNNLNLSCISGGESASYELQVSPPNSNGSFCPGNIEFTCIGRGVHIVLNWLINGSSVVQYIFHTNHHFPININNDTVNVTIVNANGSINIDIVSTLSGHFSYLRGSSIQCGRDFLLSQNIVVEGYGKFIGWK